MKTFGEGYRLMVAKNLLFRKNCIILCSECFSTVLGNLLAFVILSAMNKPSRLCAGEDLVFGNLQYDGC